MRSQKQTNRSPRPFKNQQASGRWSGGHGQNFIPGPPPKPALAARDKGKKDPAEGSGA